MCEGEALHQKAVYASAPLNWTVAKRDAHRAEYMDRLLSQTQWAAASREAKVMDPPVSSGFKVFAGHLTRSEFIGVSFSPMVRKIVLRRINILDEYLSGLKALAVGSYLRVDTSAVQIRVKPAEVIQFLQQVKAEEICIATMRRCSAELYGGDDWLTINYEEMVDKDRMADVMQGAVNHILPVALRKAAKGRFKKTLSNQDTNKRNESITNFHELCSILRPMPRYFAMLVDGLDAASACPRR